MPKTPDASPHLQGRHRVISSEKTDLNIHIHPSPTMKSKIVLTRMQFHAHHGVAAQERICGNEFVVSLELTADLSRAAETDDLAHTLNYADVYQAIKAEMDIPSNLLEHLALRIARQLFSRFPSAEALRLKVEKLNPPMNAHIHSAAVEMECTREDIAGSGDGNRPA